MTIGSSQADSPSFSGRMLSAAAWLQSLLVPFIGTVLLLRVLTDDISSPDSRHSGTLNLSGAIAIILIIVACAVILLRRRGVLAAALAAAWIFIGTAIAVGTRGASTETLREGVREGSVVALAVLVYNSRGYITAATAARLVQCAGALPALLALYQLATHTGMDVAGNIRSNGTFAHPNSAAMFFAIAAVASLWCYLLDDRHRYDAILVALFACALVATFSIDGLITLFAMFAGLGAIRSGCLRAKLAPAIIGGVVVAAFFATPLGANRIAGESSTNFSSAERGEANSSLAWRVHKWKSMLPEWEESPLVGQGLGTTTTTDRKVINEFSNALPHNEYVRYLVETGVLGLAILLLATVLLIRRLFRILRTAVPTVSGGAVLALSVVFGCLVNSLADNTLLNSPTCYAAALIVFGTLGSYSAQAARSPT